MNALKKLGFSAKESKKQVEQSMKDLGPNATLEAIVQNSIRNIKN